MNDSLQTYHRWTDGCRPSEINQIRWSMSLQNIGPVVLAKGQQRKNVNTLKKLYRPSLVPTAELKINIAKCTMDLRVEFILPK